MKEKLEYIADFKNHPSIDRSPAHLKLYIIFKNISSQEQERLEALYKSDWKAPSCKHIEGVEANKGILYINLVYKLLKDLENDRT